MDVATGDVFPAEEFGTGSRRTPLIDAPVWLKDRARRDPDGDRATLTPSDQAFLESPPTYEEGGLLLDSEAPPASVAPSTTRRVLSLLLFALIVGSASTLLGLAVAKALGRSILSW